MNVIKCPVCGGIHFHDAVKTHALIKDMEVQVLVCFKCGNILEFEKKVLDRNFPDTYIHF